jgi:hypothetical protein
MKNSSIKNIAKNTVIAATLASGLMAGNAIADTFNATLNLVQPISMSESVQMDLGSVLANDTDTCTVAAAGARSGAACFGASNGTLAAIDVSGSTGLQVDIALTNGASSGAELTFIPSLIDNGQGATTLTGVTLQASHSLSLGGTLTVANGAQAISNSITSVDYQVAVTYQ